MLLLRVLSIAAACFSLFGLFGYFLKIVRLGKPNDLSTPSGDTTKGIIYANTKAMLPQQKESAYLHLPGYVSGMLFHIGTFVCLLLFVLSFFPFFNRWISGEDKIHLIIPIGLILTCACGYGLLIRRALSRDLHQLSHPDDYLSNFLTSTFQLVTLLYLFFPLSSGIIVLYYVICMLLFIYLPFGKLRHIVYYFAARYHLGFFYGWRNVWPKNEK